MNEQWNKDRQVDQWGHVSSLTFVRFVVALDVRVRVQVFEAGPVGAEAVADVIQQLSVFVDQPADGAAAVKVVGSEHGAVIFGIGDC